MLLDVVGVAVLDDDGGKGDAAGPALLDDESVDVFVDVCVEDVLLLGCGTFPETCWQGAHVGGSAYMATRPSCPGMAAP
jgi:hypothetical protein